MVKEEYAGAGLEIKVITYPSGAIIKSVVDNNTGKDVLRIVDLSEYPGYCGINNQRTDCRSAEHLFVECMKKVKNARDFESKRSKIS